MSFNIDDMDDNILHAIAVAKETHNVAEDFSFINGLPTTEEEYNSNIRWLNGEDEDGNQLYHPDQKVTWDQVQAVVATASARNKLHKLRIERNKLLAECDWWMMPDRTPTDEQTAYRQALRDITDTYTSLDDVVWPTKP